MKREDCTLFSGAAQGAEAEFGAAAERYGAAFLAVLSGRAAAAGA